MQILTRMDDGIHSAADFWLLGTPISQLNLRRVAPSFVVRQGFRRSEYGSCRITALSECWKISFRPSSRKATYYWRELFLASMASLPNSVDSVILIVRKR